MITTAKVVFIPILSYIFEEVRALSFFFIENHCQKKNISSGQHVYMLILISLIEFATSMRIDLNLIPLEKWVSFCTRICEKSIGAIF